MIKKISLECLFSKGIHFSMKLQNSVALSINMQLCAAKIAVTRTVNAHVAQAK